MNRGVKFRIYPNKEQQNLINQTLGCCRLIYNIGLNIRNKAFENGEKVNYSKTSAILTELKRSDEFSFLRDADAVALQQSLRDLDKGFVNFFQKRARHPRFKSKHSNHQSYMVRNHRLARCISSVSWGKFFSMLEYKANWYGNNIIKVPTMYPSSQTCSCCGYRNPLVKNLAIRKWECPNCHTIHDRDTNASINILNKGLSVA